MCVFKRGIKIEWQTHTFCQKHNRTTRFWLRREHSSGWWTPASHRGQQKLKTDACDAVSTSRVRISNHENKSYSILQCLPNYGKITFVFLDPTLVYYCSTQKSRILQYLLQFISLLYLKQQNAIVYKNIVVITTIYFSILQFSVVYYSKYWSIVQLDHVYYLLALKST